MKKSRRAETVLVVDDDSSHRFMLCSMLKEWGMNVAEADDGSTAVESVISRPFDAILMDIRMARMDGLTALRRINAHNPAIPVIIMTAYSSVDSAVEAIKQGAHDYLTKPIDFDRLRLTLDKAMDHRQVVEVREAGGGKRAIDAADIIGASAPMADLLDLVAHVAPTEATVLITGESGTGKELIARALHRNSERREAPFVTVNCAALVESLLESELFGHEKGSFTGADRRRDGKFVQADGGTLFLDEITETTMAMQAKLLRVLQEHEVQRVGGNQDIAVNVRIIAASNRILEDEVSLGRFREDLFYRLNVVTLHVPPLRERREDIPLLAAHFTEKFARKNQRYVAGITPQCMDLFIRYPWPGNVRELENAVERAVILMRSDYLDEESLPLSIRRWEEGNREEEPETSGISTLEAAEKAVIIKALEETGGNKSETARRLNITRKTLHNKLSKYGIGST